MGSFKNAWYRDRHIKTNHGISPKGLENSRFSPLPNGQAQCLKCQKILCNLTVARTHYKSVHDDVKVNCQLCKRSFKNAWYRDRHIKTDHGKSARVLDFETVNVK